MSVREQGAQAEAEPPGGGGQPENEAAEAAGRNRSSSLRRALGVLDFVADLDLDREPSGAALSDIARGLGLHKSTLLRLLAPLVEKGLVDRDAESGRYRLGSHAAYLGGAYLDLRDSDFPEPAPAVRAPAALRDVRRAVATDAAPQPVGAYSQAIAAGGFLHTAGLGPQDPSTGRVVGDTVAEQTAQAMRNLAAVLAAHRLTFADVVRTTVHLQHLNRDYDAFDAVYASFLTPPHPARTTVGADLANVLIEIDATAVLPGR